MTQSTAPLVRAREHLDELYRYIERSRAAGSEAGLTAMLAADIAQAEALVSIAQSLEVLVDVFKPRVVVDDRPAL